MFVFLTNRSLRGPVWAILLGFIWNPYGQKKFLDSMAALEAERRATVLRWEKYSAWERWAINVFFDEVRDLYALLAKRWGWKE